MAGGTQSLSRSVDKVLEDCQLTGVLALHNRNLKRFPPSAARFDLGDTVTAGKFPISVGSSFVIRGGAVGAPPQNPEAASPQECCWGLRPQTHAYAPPQTQFRRGLWAGTLSATAPPGPPSWLRPWEGISKSWCKRKTTFELGGIEFLHHSYTVATSAYSCAPLFLCRHSDGSDIVVRRWWLIGPFTRRTNQ